MGEPKSGYNPQLFLTIAGGDDVGFMFEKFEWKSFTNGGYVIRARVADPYWDIIRKLATDNYLKEGRKQPTSVVYELIWPGTDARTGKQQAYMTDLDARGINAGGQLEFIAVDPPSYWLNAGDSAGKMYKGKVSDVIRKVLIDYFKSPNGSGDVDVSETNDASTNQWWMMRMDPKTFIGSLIDWSSSITEKKTNWIVSSDGSNSNPTIWVKEQGARQSVNYGMYVMDKKTPSANDIYNFEFLADNFISVFQYQLITSGITATTGRYLDRKVDLPRKIVHVYDERTSAKKNVNIGPKQGFKKPDGSEGTGDQQPHEWSTSIMAVPQFNAGDLGITYDKYIDGRARTQFLNMLNLVMRVKIRTTGEASQLLANSHNLGVSKLKIVWIDAHQQPYFLDGDWLVYGFHHTVLRGSWVTDIYCARLDYDAAAQKV